MDEVTTSSSRKGWSQTTEMGVEISSLSSLHQLTRIWQAPELRELTVHPRAPLPTDIQMDQNLTRFMSTSIPGKSGWLFERLVAAFKAGYRYQDRKLFVAEDFSPRIQQKWKTLLPVLKKMRDEGKKAFFVYPATIKYKEDHQLKVYTPK